MINCPNCNQKMNERFEYCRICGSKLNGDDLGDYSTEINNLFKDDEGYYYLFAVNGKQLVIRNKEKEELKKEILLRNYPWIEKKNLKGTQNKTQNQETEPTPQKQTENQNQETEPTPQKQQNKPEKKENNHFDDGFVYVTKEEDVNFGKIRYYDPDTGQTIERWGPDNSERAKNLRKKILGKYK